MQTNKVAPVNIYHLTYKYNIYWHMVEEKSLNIDEQESGTRNQGIGNIVE
jgi:hypothetical protein